MIQILAPVYSKNIVPQENYIIGIKGEKVLQRVKELLTMDAIITGIRLLTQFERN